MDASQQYVTLDSGIIKSTNKLTVNTTVHTRMQAYMHTCVNIIDAVTGYGGQIQQTQSCYKDTIILACWYTRHKHKYNSK